ncbi:MAG: alanine racemase [Ruthenibacterium sp.]
MEFERRCWAEIDLDALRHNFARVRAAAEETPVMAVVKADAYGHGAVRVAKLFASEGAASFAVSGLEEALELRRAGVSLPILILGYTMPDAAQTLAENAITQTVYSAQYAQALSDAAQSAGVTVTVHIKLDTGMGRIGFAVRDDFDTAAAEIAVSCALPGLSAEGIFTHFAVADSVEGDDKKYTEYQHGLVLQTVEALAAKGVAFSVVHCCNSAGTFAWPGYHHDLVRAGIILYGENPSHDVTLEGLRPALRLKAAVSHVKNVAEGDYESYGRTFCAQKPMRVATVAVGYADGYPRLLSNRGTLSLHGKPARVLGRVCMDQLMVDVTNIPETQPGDTAIVYGGGASDSVTHLADMTGTINYEILCAISRRVPRVYVENGAETSMVDYLREGKNE